MAEHHFRALARRCILTRSGVALLAVLICAFPARAHVAISEEIEAVTGLLRDDPDAAQLYLQRGNLHRIYGHWFEAMADFTRARELDPGSAAAELGMGRTRLEQGQYKKALRHLDRALAMQPGNVRALVARARARRLLGQPLAAADDYARAIEAFSEPRQPLPEYYLERARAFEAAGAGYLAAAIETLDAGTARLGNIRILEDYAIELERRRGDYAAALQRLDRIIDQSARKETLLLRRADILLQAGRAVEAQADLAAARDALEALPAQRRQSRDMQRLRTDIDNRLRPQRQPGGGE